MIYKNKFKIAKKKKSELAPKKKNTSGAHMAQY